jgi:hypothetical protein
LEEFCFGLDKFVFEKSFWLGSMNIKLQTLTHSSEEVTL